MKTYKVKIKNPIYGIPISGLDKYNPKQFEILECSAYSSKDHFGCGALFVKRSKIYARILIKLKQTDEN
jgi:hypothetical protein